LLGARGVGQHLLERIADGGFVGGAVGGELGQAQAVGGNGGDLWVMDRGCSLRLLNVMRGHQAVEGYLEALAAEIANGAWVDIPGVGKVQVSREEGKGYVTSITPGGQRIRRKVQMRLRTKIRLYEKFKWRFKLGY
jgi:hypothetical protein